MRGIALAVTTEVGGLHACTQTKEESGGEGRKAYDEEKDGPQIDRGKETGAPQDRSQIHPQNLAG